MEIQPSVKLLPVGSTPRFSAVTSIEQKRKQSSGYQHAKHRTLIKVPLTKEKGKKRNARAHFRENREDGAGQTEWCGWSATRLPARAELTLVEPFSCTEMEGTLRRHKHGYSDRHAPHRV